MDLSQLIDQVANVLIPYFESEKNIEALTSSLAAADPTGQLWGKLQAILTEEFGEGKQLDESIADRQVLKFVLKRALRNNQLLQNQLISILNSTESGNPSKNVILHSEIEAGKDVHIGDIGDVERETTGGKNRIEGSVIKAGGNFHLGDLVEKKTENEIADQVLNYNYGNQGMPKANEALQRELSKLDAALLTELGSETRQLIAKGQAKKGIKLLYDFSRQHQLKMLETEATSISSRFQNLVSQSRKGLLSAEEITRTTNQITDALLALINQLASSS